MPPRASAQSGIFADLTHECSISRAPWLMMIKTVFCFNSVITTSTFEMKLFQCNNLRKVINYQIGKQRRAYQCTPINCTPQNQWATKWWYLYMLSFCVLEFLNYHLGFWITWNGGGGEGGRKVKTVLVRSSKFQNQVEKKRREHKISTSWDTPRKKLHLPTEPHLCLPLT